MTTVAPGTHAAGQVTHKPRFTNLLKAEWTKIRSVRSTLWTLIIFIGVSIGLTALLTWLVVKNLSVGQHGSGATGLINDPVNFILGTGFGLGQLAICVLGVLVITSEYSSGTIRASVLSVPKRIPILVAKAVVFAALVFVIAEAVSFCDFFLGAAIAHTRDLASANPVFNAVLAHNPQIRNGRITVSLSQPNVTRAVIGSGLYLTVLSLFALAIGSLIRHTAGAIATVIGLVLVIFPLTNLLPSNWGAHTHAYMPTVAGVLITNDKTTSGQLLSAWQGFDVFCGWSALLLIIGGYLFYRRDA
ncbi:MAG TPA: ABC transporter permease subunit [Streptosporangiaceae bacterium]|nr:ABC transporter permease subunit [Streptosporangiaceae bacterium]